jgi:hypothetical protein
MLGHLISLGGVAYSSGGVRAPSLYSPNVVEGAFSEVDLWTLAKGGSTPELLIPLAEPWLLDRRVDAQSSRHPLHSERCS